MGDAPIAEAPLGRKQRGVAIGALSAMAVGASLFFIAPHAPLPEKTTRGLVWATAAAGPLLCLLIAVGAVANFRFFSPKDIDAAAGGSASDGLRMLQAVLQNTLEQAVPAIGTYGLLSFLVPPEAALLPLFLAGAFVAGRAAFAIGYRKGAAGRAFGFGLTMYPTAVGLGYAVYLAVRWWW